MRGAGIEPATQSSIAVSVQCERIFLILLIYRLIYPRLLPHLHGSSGLSRRQQGNLHENECRPPQRLAEGEGIEPSRRFRGLLD